MHSRTVLLLTAALVCLLTAPPPAAATPGGVRHRRQAVSLSSPECRDVNGRAGVCRPLARCPALNRLRLGGFSSTELSTLRALVCNSRTSPLLFCCVQESSNVMFPNNSLPFTGAPELHPNRRLVESGGRCGFSLSEKIRGGTEVPLGRYPWVAVLGYRDSLRPQDGITYECGGSVISQRYVLTAAHCVTDTGDFRLETVRLGEHRFSSNPDCPIQSEDHRLCSVPQEFGIEKAMFHEDYNKPALRMNDIALVKLDRPISETLFVSKVCLPFGETRLQNFTGRSLLAAGFGRTGPDSDSPKSDVLLEVDLPFVELATCQQTYRGAAVLGQGQFCVGGQAGRDSCRGDSGGPVMVEDTRFGDLFSVIGVVSFGPDACGTPGLPSINTLVSEYLNWILDRIDE